MPDAGRHARAKEIFFALCDLPPDGRREALARACDGDLELRADVEAMLEFDARRPAFLDAPRRPAPAPPSEAPERHPDVLGPFRVRRKIGEGGMGTVYEVDQERPHRTVALKLLRPDVASASRLRRFEQEGEILGRLQHPGIARIYESGRLETETGLRPYIAMELVRGQPLTHHARAHQLSPRARLALFGRVCDAVEHAHRQGVVHRDLKPANVLVDGSGEPKILDFGIARAIDSDLQLTTAHTGVGEILGTLAYMSPEQASGDRAAIDARSDVYSLGVMLYELLADELPYDLSSGPLARALETIRSAEPRRISSARSYLRGDVETIVSKALEKDRERRYASAAALAADIERFLRHEPIEARPASRVYRVRKFVRRHRTLVVASTLVAASLVAALAASLLYAASEGRRRALSDRRAQEARASAYQSAVLLSQLLLEGGNVLEMRQPLASAPEDLRGWEWQALNRSADRSLGALAVPGVFDARFRDDEHVAILDQRGVMRSWDIATSEAVELGPAVEGGRPLALSSDGAMVLAFAGGELVLADTRPGGGSTRVPFPGGEPRSDWFSASIAPEGRRLAVATDDEAIWIAEIEPTANVFRLACGMRANALLLSPDGGLLAVAADDRVHLFDVEARAERWVVRERTTDFEALAFEMPLARLAVGMTDGVRYLGLASGKPEARWTYDDEDAARVGAPFRLELDPSGRTVAAVSRSGAIRVLDAESHALRLAAGHAGWKRTTIDYAPGGETLLSCGRGDETVRVWMIDVARSEVIESPGGFVYPAVVSPDGALLASGTWDGISRVWDATSGELLAELKSGGRVYDLAFSPDGKLLVSALREKGVVVWDVAACAMLGRDERVGAASLAFEPAGARLAVGCSDGALRMLDARRVETVASIDLGSKRINALAFAPDGGALAAGTASGRLALLDAASLAESARFDGSPSGSVGEEGLLALAFSPDGQTLAAGWGGGSASLVLFHVPTLAEARRLPGHRGEVFSLAFAPDGNRLASGGRDGILRLWDPVSGALLSNLTGHDSYIYSLAFTPDGRRIVTGSGDATIRVWDSAPVAVGWRERAQWRRERAELEAIVERAFDETSDANEVVDRLARDPALSEARRRQALALVVRHSDRARAAADATEAR